MENSKGNKPHSLYSCDRIDADSYKTYKNFTTENLLIIRCVCGCAEVNMKGEVYKITPDNFLLLFPRTLMETVYVSGDFQAYCIGAPLGLHENEIARLDLNFFKFLEENPLWNVTPAQKAAIDGFCNMFGYVCDEISSSMRSDILSSLHSIFFRVLYENAKPLYKSPEAKQNLGRRTLVMRFVMLLKEHFRESHSVAYYADKLCVSSKYLTYVTKTTAGVTPKAVIDHVVAVESIYLLARTPQTVQEISFILGFPDQSYFGRFFKRAFGISPMAFRNDPNLDIMNKLYDKVKKSSVPGLETEDVIAEGL